MHAATLLVDRLRSMGKEAPTGAREFSSSRGERVHQARLAGEAQHPVPYPWLFVGTEPGERSPRSLFPDASPLSGNDPRSSASQPPSRLLRAI